MNIKKVIIWGIIGSIATFLMTSFIHANIDFTTWSENDRSLFIFFVVCIFGLSALINIIEESEKGSNMKKVEEKVVIRNNFSDNIRDWAQQRGLLDNPDIKAQTLKLVEECGELASAILKNKEKETKDAIGDCMVVLTVLCHMKGYDMDEILTDVWNEIKDRKGKTENGVFIKD